MVETPGLVHHHQRVAVSVDQMGVFRLFMTVDGIVRHKPENRAVDMEIIRTEVFRQRTLRRLGKLVERFFIHTHEAQDVRQAQLGVDFQLFVCAAPRQLHPPVADRQCRIRVVRHIFVEKMPHCMKPLLLAMSLFDFVSQCLQHLFFPFMIQPAVADGTVELFQQFRVAVGLAASAGSKYRNQNRQQAPDGRLRSVDTIPMEFFHVFSVSSPTSDLPFPIPDKDRFTKIRKSYGSRNCFGRKIKESSRKIPGSAFRKFISAALSGASRINLVILKTQL